MSHGPFVIVDKAIGEGAPVRAISHLEPEAPWDSGFMLFAGEPNDEIDTEVVCIDCLLEEYPDIGAALDHAKQHGEAIVC